MSFLSLGARYTDLCVSLIFVDMSMPALYSFSARSMSSLLVLNLNQYPVLAAAVCLL